MDKIRLYKLAYRLLDSSTPLKTDCGSLCGKACCKGDEESGMHLFPGEESIYVDTPSFLSIKPTLINYTPADSVKLAVCRGSCDRSLRPLSCRIFPLVPYIDSNNVLSVMVDPRAELVCPIAGLADRKKVNQFFVRNVKRAFQILIKDKDIGEYIKWLSGYIDDYKNVKSMFQKGGI